MPAVALAGVIVLNTTHGGNEIILLDRAIYRRKPFNMWSSFVYAALLKGRNPWGRPRGVVSAHRFIIHQEHESVSSSSRASFRVGRRTMRARRILVPGQKGTKKLLRHCDSQLMCVRYRYNAESRLRFPTVEPIIEQASWSLSLPRMTGTTLVGVLGVDELSLQRQVKQAGGKWNPVECV